MSEILGRKSDCEKTGQRRQRERKERIPEISMGQAEERFVL